MPTPLPDYHHVNTAADARALTGLTAGQLVTTGGYSAVGDGGGFLYRYSAAQADSGRKDELAVTSGGFLIPIDDLLVVNPLRWGVRPGKQAYDATHDYNSEAMEQVVNYLLDTASQRANGFGGVIAFPPGRFELNINLNGLKKMRTLSIVGAGAGATVLKNRQDKLAKPVIYRDRAEVDNCVINLQSLRVWAEGEVAAPAVSLASWGVPVEPDLSKKGRVYGSIRDVHIQHDSRAQPALEIFAALGMTLQHVATEGGGVSLLLEECTSCVVDGFHALDAASGIWVLRGGSHVFDGPRVENDHGDSAYAPGAPYDDIRTFGLRITDSGHNLFSVYGEEGGDYAQWGLLVEGSATDPQNVGGKYGASISNRIVNSMFNRPRTYVTGETRGTILVRGHVQDLTVEARVVNASQLEPPTGQPLYPTVKMSSWQLPASGSIPYPTLIRIEGVDDKDFGDDAPVFDLADGTRAVRVRSYWFKKGRWTVAGEVKALTAAYTIKSVESGFAFSNQGAAATVTLTLPAAHPGHELQFYALAAGQVLRLDPASSETIRGGGAGKYAQLASGTTVTLKCVVAGTWEVVGLVGTITYEP